jgi:hypothetical protein
MPPSALSANVLRFRAIPARVQAVLTEFKIHALAQMRHPVRDQEPSEIAAAN